MRTAFFGRPGRKTKEYYTAKMAVRANSQYAEINKFDSNTTLNAFQRQLTAKQIGFCLFQHIETSLTVPLRSFLPSQRIPHGLKEHENHA
jgi:hypothetical protein